MKKQTGSLKVQWWYVAAGVVIAGIGGYHAPLIVSIIAIALIWKGFGGRIISKRNPT